MRLSQKDQKALRTYELLIPAGAPGGSGYTDPVTPLYSLHHTGMLSYRLSGPSQTSKTQRCLSLYTPGWPFLRCRPCRWLNSFLGRRGRQAAAFGSDLG